jgi:ACR3 family arsenite efflux pump ArsB
MWPILTKGQSDNLVIVMQADLLVQYEKLPAMFQTVTLWRQIILSVVLNWIIGPFVSVSAHCEPIAYGRSC